MQLDEEIRRHAELLLGEHYEHLRVEVGGARFIKGRGAAIYELAIFQPMPTGERRPLLELDEVFLHCPTDFKELASGKIRVTRVVAKRPVLYLLRQQDGRWSVSNLLPLPQFGNEPPLVEVNDASIILADEAQQDSSPITVRGIDLVLNPVASQDHQDGNVTYSVMARATGARARLLELNGQVTPDDGAVDLTVDIRDLEVSPELLTAIATLEGKDFGGLELFGRLSGKIELDRAAGSHAPLVWQSEYSLEKGRLIHPRLPRAITDLAMRGGCRSHQCVIELLTGKCGTADLSLACNRAGWQADAPLGLRARIVGLPLDTHLKRVLPPSLDRLWNSYDPAGTVDADLAITFDGQSWLPQLTIVCRSISFTEKNHFPYQLEQGTGVINFEQKDDEGSGALKLDLVAQAQGRPIQVVADLTGISLANADRPTTAEARESRRPVGRIEVSAQEVPIHQELLDALDEESRRVVDALQPEGHFDFHWRAELPPSPDAPPDISLELTLNSCAIQYEGFPYLLQNVCGRVTSRNKVWQLHNLESRHPNRRSVVHLTGKSVPSGDGRQLSLVLTGNDVPFEDSLRRSLDSSVQQVWDTLRPQGLFHFSAAVNHHSVPAKSTKPDLRVTLQPVEGSASLDPSFLTNPYRLDNVTGTFTYADRQVTLKNVRAHHGRVSIGTQGSWRDMGDEGWQLQLHELSADHLTASRELILAMPPALQRVLEDLQPNGTFTLHKSAFAFHAPADPSQRPTSSWNVKLVSHQSDLDCGVQLEDVSGELQLIGKSDGQRGYTSGELALDSLVWNDLQLTSLRGPMWIDHNATGSLALLGREASTRQGHATGRDLTADAYGGTVIANLQVRNEGYPQFQLTASVAGANLARFANEQLGGASGLTGAVNGHIRLFQNGRSADALGGEGEVHVVDANIYRLNFLVALLKALQNRTPNTTAFNQCDANFTIHGQHAHFQRFNLVGDAVSLHGRGQTRFDGNDLQLVFHARVGRSQLPIPVLSSLMGQASEQILQLRVDGTVQQPNVHPEALPVMGQMLEQIQEEFQPMVGSGTRAAESRFPFWPFR